MLTKLWKFSNYSGDSATTVEIRHQQQRHWGPLQDKKNPRPSNGFWETLRPPHQAGAEGPSHHKAKKRTTQDKLNTKARRWFLGNPTGPPFVTQSSRGQGPLNTRQTPPQKDEKNTIGRHQSPRQVPAKEKNRAHKLITRKVSNIEIASSDSHRAWSRGSTCRAFVQDRSRKM